MGEGDETEGLGFFVVGMCDGGFLAFLPGGEDGFAGIVGETVGVGGVGDEVFWGDLFSVEEGNSESICEEGAEFFHKVEGEAGAAGAVSVEEADLGVEAGGDEGGGTVVCEEGVEEGEEGVGGIRWRAADAAWEGDAGGRKKMCIDGESACGGISFKASKSVEVWGWRGLDACDDDGELVGGGVEVLCGLGAFACTAAEDGAGVGDFGEEEPRGEACGGGGVEAGSVLSAAEEDVAGGIALDAGKEGTVFGEAGDRDGVVGAMTHEEGGDEDVAEGDDAATEEMDGEELFAGFSAELDAFAFFGKVGALGEDVEGVEAGEHGAGLSWSGVGGFGEGLAEVGCDGRRGFAVLGEGTSAATVVGCGWRDLALGEEVSDGGDGGFDLGAELGGEGDVLSASCGAVEESSGGNSYAEHFFEAECLGTELEGVGVVFLGSSVLVFDGEGWGVLAELDGIGLANEAEALGDELEAAAGTDTVTDFVAGFVDAFVHEAAFGGETVLFPNAGDVDKGALAGADPPVLECGEWDTLQVGHLPSSLSETMVMPVGKSFSFTVTS